MKGQQKRRKQKVIDALQTSTKSNKAFKNKDAKKRSEKKNEAITAVEVNPTHLIRPSNGPCSSHTAKGKIRISRKMQIDRSLIHPYLTSVPLLIS